MCNWILSILKKDLKPIIELIEETNTSNWEEREKYYISLYTNLLNSSLGGEGTFGFKHSKETIEKLRLQKVGHKQSTETLQKRSKSLKGRIFSSAHKAKIGNGNRGKNYTDYKILVKDIILNTETICNSVIEVTNIFNIPASTVRRNFNKNSIVRKRYTLVKI